MQAAFSLLSMYNMQLLLPTEKQATGLFLWHPTNSPFSQTQATISPSVLASWMPSKQQCQHKLRPLAWRLPAQRDQPGQGILACHSMNSEEGPSWRIQPIIHLNMSLTQLLLH